MSDQPKLPLRNAPVILFTVDLLGTNDALAFKLHGCYTFCRLCGVIYQSALDRANIYFPTDKSVHEAMLLRKHWSQRHAQTHLASEHIALAHSGMFCTPEATNNLASYGIITAGDAVFSTDHMDALAKSTPVPINDVEGT